MAVAKFLKNFFTVIFSFVFGILLLLLVCVIFSKGFLNEVNIDRCINSIDIFESRHDEILQSSNNEITFGQEISNELFDLGISRNFTEAILKSSELEKIISDYSYNYIKYVLFYDEMPIFSAEEIIKIVDSHNMKLGDEKLSKEQSRLINTYIIDLTNDINRSVPTNNDLINMGYDVEFIKIISTISFSNEFVLIIIMCLILFTLLITLCVNRFIKALKVISFPTLFVGFILVIGYILEVKIMNLLVNGDGFIESMILMIANEMFKDFFIYGIALIIVGILLLIIVAIFAKKPKNDINNDYQLVEKRSYVKEQLKDHIALSDEDIEKIDNTLVKKEKEIEMINLPLENDIMVNEEIKVNYDNELPKVSIASDFVNNSFEDVKPVLLKENIKLINDDKIKFVEMESNSTRNDNMSLDNSDVSYFEMSLDNEKSDDIIKKEIDITPLENVDLKVVSPVKGKEIKVDLENSEEKEEDIEML